MSTTSRVIKNTGYLYIKMAITVFISLWTTRIVLNSLGALDFGTYNIVGGAIAMLGFLNSTMTSATQRFMNYAEGQGDKERQKSIFNVSMLLHIIVAVSFGLILVIAAYPLFNGILTILPERLFAAKVVYGSMMLSTMFTVISVPYNAAINAHENMKYYAIIGVFESLLKLIVAFITMKFMGDKLITYGILMACIPFISLTILRIYCRIHYEECILSMRKYCNKHLFKEMTTFAGWNFLGSTSSIIGNYGMGVVLNHFFGSLLNAAQGIANQLNGQLLSFSNNMLKAASPLIAKNEGAGNRKGMLQVSMMANKYSFFLLALFAIPAILEMPFLLKVWLKNVPDWAIIFSQLLLVRSLIDQSVAVFHTSIAAEGHIANYNKLVVFLDILPLLITWFLFANHYPPVAMYIVIIALMGLGKGGLKVYYMKTNCGMHFSQFMHFVLKPILLVSFIAFLVGFTIVSFVPSGWMRLGIVLVCVGMSFLASLWCLGMDANERTEVKGLLLKQKRQSHVL